jgi:non-ribosomal peptide synthetase component F
MRSVVTEFERIATRCAARVAISSGLWQPTYRELNEAANRLAHRLIDAGVGLCDRTAILMSHDSPLVAAIVGGVKAGQIVVVLDPGDPRPRLKALIEDTEPSAIVTDAARIRTSLPRSCRPAAAS